jgi:hypothetical protein
MAYASVGKHTDVVSGGIYEGHNPEVVSVKNFGAYRCCGTWNKKNDRLFKSYIIYYATYIILYAGIAQSSHLQCPLQSLDVPGLAGKL